MTDTAIASGAFAEHAWSIGVDVALKATVLFVAALLLDRAIRARHLLACSSMWNACLIGLALLPLAALAFPRLRIECLPAETAATDSRPAPLAIAQPIPNTGQQHLDLFKTPDPTVGQANLRPMGRSDEPQISWETIESRVDSPAFRPGAAPLPAVRRPSVSWQSRLLCAYLVGVAVLVVRLAKSLRAVGRLRRMSRPLIDARWKNAVHRWCHKLAIDHPVGLAHSREIDTPVVIGWRQPMILVPTPMVSTVTAGQRDAILVHELAHIGRADYPWQLLFKVLQIAYWFHPLAWVTGRSICSARERACDDYCIHWLGDRGEYGTALLDLARRMVRCRGLALGLAAVRLSTIEQRLAHIDQSTGVSQCLCPRRFRALLVAAAAVSTILVGSLELCRAEATAEEPDVSIQAADKSRDQNSQLDEKRDPKLMLAEARKLLTSREQTAAVGESQSQTFIVSFKGANSFAPRTAKELLDGFGTRHQEGARTHHFRTEENGGVLIGHICVDGEAGKNSLVKLLAESERVTLVNCIPGTLDAIKRHMELGQARLGESNPKQLLERARKSLTGQRKDDRTARQLLTELAGKHVDDLPPTDLCYAYVYLGYIEDRAGRRDAAIVWYKKAVPLEGPSIQGIRRVAEIGMTKPITWIRHLDQGARQESTPRTTAQYNHPPLDFALTDVFGRRIRSSDYAGKPLLLQFGACWCGGCQQDARPLGEIAARFGPKGLHVVRCVAGENELTALEFLKHYRLPIIHLMDVNRTLERRYNKRGWPFLVLVNGEGKVVYTSNASLVRPNEDLTQAIQDLLHDDTAESATTIRDGVPYAAATLARSDESQTANRRDRFPSMACGPDGHVYVVFTSNRNGNSDVFLRVFDGKNWSQDRAVAGTEADEYDGTVLVDQDNRVWVSWTSNADGRNYNIFARSMPDSAEPADPVQLTQSDDDAMHGRMACDRNGHIWITYYKWHRMGDYSRDKEVYVRRFDGEDWSDELHVSPDNVPEYEDHTDPAIIPYADGVAICWSWDFHPPRGYTGNARTPTVFLRTIDENLGLGQVTTVSAGGIDTAPAMGRGQDHRIWFAWDSSRSFASKEVYLHAADLDATAQGTVGASLSDNSNNVCTPGFSRAPNGGLALVWSESDPQAIWRLKTVFLDGTAEQWTRPTIAVAEGDPRFPTSAYDNEGRLWIAYSANTKSGREIQITRQDIPFE